MANYPAYQPMYPQYGYQQPMMPQPVQTVPQPVPQPVQPAVNNGYICCPVTSRVEAEAYRVEAFGPAVLMPDIGHGVVYYKKFNQQTGGADFAEFKSVMQEQAPAIDYNAVLGMFTNRLDGVDKKLEDVLEKLKTPKPAAKGAVKE